MNEKIFKISARLSSIEMDGQNLPTEIQWAPPGEHSITADFDGEPDSATVRITQRVADAVANSFRQYSAKAAQGAGDHPYLDFNHEDREASARVLDVYWGGDNPKTGGVRLKVDWSQPGKDGVLGKAWSRFSPQFFMNAAGEITGAPLNMGGLVNRAAFKTIAPVAAHDRGRNHTQRKMTDQEIAALQAAKSDLDNQVKTLTAKVASLESDQTVKAKDVEITTLKSQVAERDTTIKAHKKERATSIVQAAIRAGKLAPQATEVHARWTALIEADEANSKLLDDVPVNPALGTVVAAGAAGTTTTTGTGTPAEQFVTLVKAKHTELKDKAKALQAAIQDKPELYKAWRDADGKPGLSV